MQVGDRVIYIEYADLHCANLEGANLSSASLWNADLRGADQSQHYDRMMNETD